MSTRKHNVLAPMSKDVTQAQYHDMQVSQTSTSDNEFENYAEINLCP
jgi:hypothetical protein